MPVMDGYEATKIIRATNKTIPIVALSANAMIQDINMSKSIGMNEHLSKPIEIEKLYAVLVKYLSKDIIKKENIVNFGFNFVNIDAQKGLEYSNNRVELYIKMVKKFADDYRDLNIDLNNLEHKRTVHNIKGLSGYLRAEKLYLVAKELEEEKWDFTTLQKFNTELKIVINEIDSIMPNVEKCNMVERLSRVQFEEKLKALKEQLEKYRPKGVNSVMEELSKYKLDEAEKKIFDTICSLKESYRYKEILDILEGLNGK